MIDMRRCSTCGRFHKAAPGSAWKTVYSGWPPTPDDDITRCLSCVEKVGPFHPQDGIRPEYSCGLVAEHAEKP